MAVRAPKDRRPIRSPVCDGAKDASWPPDALGRQAPEVIEGADLCRRGRSGDHGAWLEPRTCPNCETAQSCGEPLGHDSGRLITGATEFGWWSMPWVTSCAGRVTVVWGHQDGRDCAQAILEKMGGQRVPCAAGINAPFSVEISASRAPDLGVTPNDQVLMTPG